jgi:osmotically-inducible protein OsmY
MTDRDTRNQQADWNDSDRRDRDAHRGAPGQPQQWHDESYGGGGYGGGQAGSGDCMRNRDYGSGQQGGSSGSYSGGGFGGGGQRSWQDEDARARRGGQSGGDYRDEAHAYGSGYYDDVSGRFGSFDSEDQGGRDFSGSGAVGQGYYTGRTSGGRGSYGSDRGRSYRGTTFGDVTRGANSDYHPRGYVTAGRDYIPDSAYNDWRSYGESRGFFSRAGDEVASWFGDEDATRRREQDHRQSHSGRGPSDYTRSDERIREDANDALTHDHLVDASQITVKVEKGEVTLQGTVDSRQAKRHAEDAVDHVSGVKHVQNNLRVHDDRNRSASSGQSGSSWSAGSGSSGTSATSGTTTTAANKTS